MPPDLCLGQAQHETRTPLADPRHPQRDRLQEGPPTPHRKDIPQADEAGLGAVCEVGQADTVVCVLPGSLPYTWLWSHGARAEPEGSPFEKTSGALRSQGPSRSLLGVQPGPSSWLDIQGRSQNALPGRAPPRSRPSHHARKGPATWPSLSPGLPFLGPCGMLAGPRPAVSLTSRAPPASRYSHAGCRAPLPAPHRRQGS